VIGLTVLEQSRATRSVRYFCASQTGTSSASRSKRSPVDSPFTIVVMGGHDVMLDARQVWDHQG
jgi:hypothetical protein